MANNYTVSSLTFFPKDLDKKVKFSPAARCLISTQICHDYDFDDEECVVIDMGSGTGTDCLDRVLTDLAEDAHIELHPTTTVGNLFDYLEVVKYIDAEVAKNLSVWLGRDILIEDNYDSVNLPDMLKFFIHDPECNYGGCYEETGWYCDRSRHGEFGGGVGITSEHFNFSSYPAMYSDVMYKVTQFPGDATVLASIITGHLRTELHGIKDPVLRGKVQGLIISKLVNDEETNHVPSTGL